LKYSLNSKEYNFLTDLETKFPKAESHIQELLAHFRVTSFEEILKHIQDLKLNKADKDKFGHLEKKVMDNTNRLDELMGLIN
jgi:hypothetical protein